MNYLYIKNRDIEIARYSDQILKDIATEQGRTVEELGAAVYKIASTLEKNGNRGISTRHLDLDLKTDVISHGDHAPAWESILYKNKDGMWYARKHPHWMLAWGYRYGWQTDIGQQIIETHRIEALDIHAEVLVYLESLKPKRFVDTIAGKRAEDLTTLEVAYVAAVADVLQDRALHRRCGGTGFDSASSILFWHYQHLHKLAFRELEYRTQSSPETRRSKKKTLAAVEDWKRAESLLLDGTGYFFSQEFIRQAVESAEEPDLQVNFEQLPRQPDATTPIRWLSDGQLVRQFMAWVDADSDPNSFEYEDKQTILRQLRLMFARASGQHAGIDTVILTGGD